MQERSGQLGRHMKTLPEHATEYRRSGWWLPELLDAVVLARDIYSGEKEAVADSERRLTRAELGAAVSACAARLTDAGIRAGDRIVVQLPNNVEFLVVILALISLGAPPVLARPVLRDHELNQVLLTMRPAALAVPVHQDGFNYLAMAERLQARHPYVRLLLVSGATGKADLGADQLDLTELPAATQSGAPAYANDARQPTDIAFFLLSNGTTGPPKAIPRTHEAYGHVIRVAAEVSGLTVDSVYLAAQTASAGFVFGHPGVLGTLARGGRVVLTPPDDPATALSLIERERVTHCALRPAVAMQWLSTMTSNQYNVSSLEVLQVGGSRLDVVLAARLSESFGCRIQQVYGMSEGLLNFTRLDDPVDVTWTTQGRPASPGDETLIVDDAGHPVPEGQIGELIARGPGITTGYYGGASSSSFTADGYYRTGDLVSLHSSGNFVVAGRVKDVINRAGQKVPSDELEELTVRHPGVHSAAAVAMPHPLLGEAVCLYVVAEEHGTPTLQEIRAFLEQCGLAQYKLPERLVLVSSLPLVGIGKINKVRLREDIAARIKSEPEPSLATTAS